MGFDFAEIWRSLPLLLDGMGISLLLTALAIAGGLSLGTVLAVMRLSRLRVVRAGAATYVVLFRSLPLLLLIFWFYFLIPLWLGHPIAGFDAALIAFVLFEAAFFCEIIRSGIGSVRQGQIMAGLATGLSYVAVMRSIILPQALRNMVPVLLLQCVNLFKSTSLVYVVGVRDFLTAAEIVGTRDHQLSEFYIFAALVYFTLCFAAARFVKRLERRYAQ